MATNGPGNRPHRANLNQEVAQHIRDLILSGEARPGTKIDQDQVAENLGVSRLPVREALITLEAEGVIANVPRRGSYVAQLEPDDFKDHYEMFGHLSGMAAARAATIKDPSLIAKLRAINADMRKSTIPADRDALNVEFHRLINKAGSSRRLRSVLRILSNSMPTSFFAQQPEWEWKKDTLDEHDAIVDAIEAGDSAAADNAVAVHFHNTGEQAVRMLQDSGFWNADSN